MNRLPNPRRSLEMARGVMIWSVLCLALAVSLSAPAQELKAVQQPVTVTGTVSAEFDDQMNVLGITVDTGDGIVWNVAVDENGTAMAKEMNGKRAEVTGSISKTESGKLLAVSGWKAVESDA